MRIAIASTILLPLWILIACASAIPCILIFIAGCGCILSGSVEYVSTNNKMEAVNDIKEGFLMLFSLLLLTGSAVIEFVETGKIMPSEN